MSVMIGRPLPNCELCGAQLNVHNGRHCAACRPVFLRRYQHDWYMRRVAAPRPMTVICDRCGVSFPNSKSGTTVRCKPCRVEWQRDYMKEYSPPRRRADKLKMYGITPDDYDAMLVAQCGACAICGGTNDDGRALYVDHDHITGAIRGLLCVRCTTGLGFFRDNSELVARAGAFLVGA